MTTKDLNTRLARIESKIDRLRETAEKPYDLAAAAEYLRVSRSFLYKLTSKGRISFYRPGGKTLYFDKADLDDYIRRGRDLAVTRPRPQKEEATQQA